MSHDPHGNPDLQHHFDTMGQQFSAAKLGMWLFLAQEVLFFGGLFCAYVVYRVNHPELYSYAAQALDTKMGFLNTIVLLISSLTMALAVRCAQLSKRPGLLLNLALTFVCAGVFMGVKYVEYKAKFSHGTLPGHRFDWKTFLAQVQGTLGEVTQAPVGAAMSAPQSALTAVPADARSQIPPAAPAPQGFQRAAPSQAHRGVAQAETHADHGEHDEHGGHHLEMHGERPPNLQIFFGLYFCLTGLHGIHVLAGMLMLGWLFVGAWKGRYHRNYFTPVDLGGLYWHLVDLVWIFLFPLLYLI